MIPWLDIIRAFAAGLALGFFFFGGLWVTIKRLPCSAHPRTLVWSSFLCRQLLTVSTLLILCRADWHKWAAALAGFLIVRTLMLYQHRVGHLAKNA